MATDDTFIRQVECDGSSLVIHQLMVGDEGCVVWDAALVLSKFLENPLYFTGQPKGYWKGRRVVELGGGTGVVGLVACALGADVILTDLSHCIPLMEKNIKENDHGMGGTIKALVLDWCQDDVSHVSPPSPDVILMADVVYYHQVVHHLVKTLLSLCSTDTLVMMSHEVRTTGDKTEVVASFFNLMSQHFMEYLVPFDSLHPSHRSQDILIHLFKLKSNQLSN